MILVNAVPIPENAVMAEMQYHPAPEKRGAMLKAAESLIISELLKQRAMTLGLADESKLQDHSPLEQDQVLDLLIATEVTIPQANSAECLQYYQQNPNRFVTSPLLEVRHILLPAAPEAAEERAKAKQLAESIIAELHKAADFGSLAANYSVCSTKDCGGLLGQISKGQTVPEFERQVFKAQPGLMPYPVESRYGMHVVDVLRRIEGDLLPYDAVASKIRDYLNEKVRRKAIAQYIETLISAARIDGYDFSVSSSPLMQ